MNRGNLSDQPVFWIGQVVPKQDANKTSLDRWGSRVKVRIMGIHSASGTETPDSALFSSGVTSNITWVTKYDINRYYWW